jgi:hypothetical protein
MSVQDHINKVDDFFNGKMDRIIECTKVLHDTFVRPVLSALVVDTTDDIPIQQEGKLLGIHSKYLDLSQCVPGDYELFVKSFVQRRYEGLLLDNIDNIPNNEDHDDWEVFVRFALKRENDFQPFNMPKSINFGQLHIAARCKKNPDYLNGRSLQCVVVNLDTSEQ